MALAYQAVMKAILSTCRPSGTTIDNEDDKMEDSKEIIAQILEDVFVTNGSEDDFER